MLLEMTGALTSVTNDIVPLVFYGTAFALAVKYILNFLFCIFFLMIMRHDAGYKEWVQTNKCHPWSLVIIGGLVSYKLHKVLYTFGRHHTPIPFQDKRKILNFYNILTTLNIVLALVPVILIDVYGLAKYKWGNQFYMMMIETFIFSCSMIVMQWLEYRNHKNSKEDYDVFGANQDMSAAIDDEVQRRLGEALDEYARKLKAERDGNKPLRRVQSMCDIGDRYKEEDDRRVNTDPLDHKRKKIYEDRMNPYHQVMDHDFPDNCYAEVGRNLHTSDGNGISKIQQTG
jgi:uncharacterized membrane protein